MDGLIGNLKTHEMNRSHNQSKKEVKKDKSLMLKYQYEEDSSDDDDMTYLIKRFQKIVRKTKVLKREQMFLEQPLKMIHVLRVEKVGTL